MARSQTKEPSEPPSLAQTTASKLHGESVDFLRDIQPIFRKHCYECHAGTTEEGGLNLGLKAKALQGGHEGAAITVGDSQSSRLIQRIASSEEERLMPPPQRDRLTNSQIRKLQTWIDQGAIWPDGNDVIDPKFDRAQTHWAFQRLRQVPIPVTTAQPANTMNEWAKTPIDRFIQLKLEEAELRPAFRADARTLIRRVFFDLIGLPPTPEQTAHFEAAFAVDSDIAMQNLVDQLLASPLYGERWGRHWLDVARYADSDGQEADQDRPHAYTYRDFVIQALNDDLAFDHFVRWQIAGDEYEPNHDAAIAATGFLVAGTAFKLPEKFLESERLMNRYNELDDVVSTLGAGLLGITVACARCHDHKYDAFSAKEYYQLLGVFHSGDRVTAELPSGRKAFVFKDFDSQRRPTWLFRRGDFFDRDIHVELGFPAMLSSGATAEQYWQNAKHSYALQHGEPKSTLQRRALADWITDTQQGGGALLARVMVNRVWHHHFGKGLVTTTSDFGVQGDPPSHPELLDFLANEFVTHGWQLKWLHRQILTSSVWQQASTQAALDPHGTEVDPSNQWLWRRLPQRLEAEVLRDSILALSETLNLESGGAGFKPYIAPEANLARNIKGEAYPKNAKDNADTRRRSVYMFHKRLIPYPMFQAFDRPDFMVSCARRQNTTVAPQAMVLLNDRFVRTVARDFAIRLLERHGYTKDAKRMPSQPIAAEVFQRSFNRPASTMELDASIHFIDAQLETRLARGETEAHVDALADFCQTIFGLNEFLYVD